MLFYGPVVSELRAAFEDSLQLPGQVERAQLGGSSTPLNAEWESTTLTTTPQKQDKTWEQSVHTAFPPKPS